MLSVAGVVRTRLHIRSVSGALLAGALVIQAGLYLTQPGFLPMWGDELFTLTIATLPIPQMLHRVAADIHPPLYYLLLHFWVKLPIGSDPLARMRLLSGIFGLTATAALYFLFLRKRPMAEQGWCLGLWALSPALMLYARMARSYSLQVTVSLVAIFFLLRLLEEPADLRRATAWGGAVALALYTHYLPGLTVLGAGGLVLLWRLRQLWLELVRTLLCSCLVTLVLYLPWLRVLDIATTRWRTHGNPYYVTGNFWAEQIVKLGYWFVSFHFGENISFWGFWMAVAFSPFLMWLAWAGLRTRPAWLPVAVAAGLIGYVGASRWVMYPFIPARALFLLPFLVLALAVGARVHRRAGAICLAILAAFSINGIRLYFEGRDFLNRGYAVPYTQMVSDILAPAGRERTLVLVGIFTDTAVFVHYVEGKVAVRPVLTAKEVEAIRPQFTSGRWDRIWLVRNTHDISPGSAYEKLEAEAKKLWRCRLHEYSKRTALDEFLIRSLGWREQSPYYYQMLELCRKTCEAEPVTGR